MDENENYQVNQVIRRYEESGFDKESIDMAKRDLARGVELDVVDTYMSMKVVDENRLMFAEAFHRGLPLALGKKIANKEKNFQREVLSHIDGTIPMKAIERIVDTSKSLNQVRVAFKDYMEEVQMVRAGTMKKDARDEPETTVNMANVERNHIPATAPMEEEKPKPDKKKKKPVQTVFDKKPEPAPKPESLKPRIPEVQIEKQSIPSAPERQVDLYNKLMHLMEEMIDVNRKALDAVVTLKDKSTTADPVPRYVPNAFEKASPEREREKVDTGDEKLDRVEVSRDAVIRPFKEKYKREPEAPVQVPVPERKKPPARPVIPHVDGYMRMVMMPDGRIRPITIEYTPRSEKKGFAAFVSRLFGKGSSQESLVKQLINRKMKASQLKVILRAVRERLEPDIIRELVNCDLPADEMDNIIDVAIEEMNMSEEEEMLYDPFVEVE